MVKHPARLPKQFSVEPRINRLGIIFDESLSELQISETNEYFRDVFSNQPTNTFLAYDSDLIIYRQFCESHGHMMVSADPVKMKAAIRGFFDWQLQKNNSKYTISRRLNTISIMLGVVNVYNPIQKHHLFKEYKKTKFKQLSGQQKQAKPIDGEMLESINDSFTGTRPVDARDMAMINCMFDGLLRRSEIINMRLVDIDRDENAIFLPESKTDKENRGSYRFISDTSIAMVNDWVNQWEPGTFQQSDYLWRPMSPKGTSLLKSKGPLSGRSINKMIRKTVNTTLGNSSGYSSHSMRVGMAIEMAKNDVPTSRIAQAGGWKSEQMVLKYIRHLHVKDSGAADVAKAMSR
jgi:site-specific recombinase XerD